MRSKATKRQWHDSRRRDACIGAPLIGRSPHTRGPTFGSRASHTGNRKQVPATGAVALTAEKGLSIRRFTRDCRQFRIAFVKPVCPKVRTFVLWSTAAYSNFEPRDLREKEKDPEFVIVRLHGDHRGSKTISFGRIREESRVVVIVDLRRSHVPE